MAEARESEQQGLAQFVAAAANPLVEKKTQKVVYGGFLDLRLITMDQ